MKHAIKVLRAELEAVKVRRFSYEHAREAHPNQMRPSEWARALSNLRTNELELIEAIQVLGKVGLE